MEWTIKQMSDYIGISADTLRYYDKLGIVSPKRLENGYRYYNENDLANLQYITVMKYAQFELSDIKMMIGLFAKEPGPDCGVLTKEILTTKCDLLREAVVNYQNIIHLIDEIIPMIGTAVTNYEDKNEIDQYVQQIFKDIQNGRYKQLSLNKNKK